MPGALNQLDTNAWLSCCWHAHAPTSSAKAPRLPQVLPHWVKSTGATLARLQIVQCWESKRQWESNGNTSDPRASIMLGQVLSVVPFTIHTKVGFPECQGGHVIVAM